MKTIFITGGTGLVGTRLIELLLEREYNIILASRNETINQNPIFKKIQEQYPNQLSSTHWNPSEKIVDPDAIAKADIIINLAGAGIAERRWTADRKREIYESRVLSGQLIVESLQKFPNKVTKVISASGISWYGDDKDRTELTPFKEDTPPANDFLAKTCVAWENSVQPIAEMEGKSLVIYRIGIVLSHQGGMIPELIKTLNLRIASVFGTGHQIMSWIHIDDLCDMFIAAIEMEEIKGVYNAVVPFSVTNERLIKTIAEKIHKGKYAKLKVPKTILKMALGEMSNELLKSCLVSSKKILDTGFSFQYPRIKDAIDDIIRK